MLKYVDFQLYKFVSSPKVKLDASQINSSSAAGWDIKIIGKFWVCILVAKPCVPSNRYFFPRLYVVHCNVLSVLHTWLHQQVSEVLSAILLFVFVLAMLKLKKLKKLCVPFFNCWSLGFCSHPLSPTKNRSDWIFFPFWTTPDNFIVLHTVASCFCTSLFCVFVV